MTLTLTFLPWMLWPAAFFVWGVWAMVSDECGEKLPFGLASIAFGLGMFFSRLF